VAVPKAVLQQHCHKSRPPLPNPRFTKASRAGEPYRYTCTIVFPKPLIKKKNPTGDEGASGPRTWQLIEAEDGWEEIQDAQNAVALRALLELRPHLTDTHRLLPPFKCADT
jgi:Double-stranded RNA binding motif